MTPQDFFKKYNLFDAGVDSFSDDGSCLVMKVDIRAELNPHIKNNDSKDKNILIKFIYSHIKYTKDSQNIITSPEHGTILDAELNKNNQLNITIDVRRFSSKYSGIISFSAFIVDIFVMN